MSKLRAGTYARACLPIAVVVAASLALGACGSSNSSSSSTSSGSTSGSSTSSSGGSSTPIQIGETMGLSGPAGAYGQAQHQGQDAIFKKVNAEGGVNGRQLQVNVLDDAMDTARSVQNTKQLIGNGNVAILNGAGAGGIDAMAVQLSKAKVPFLFPGKCSPAYADHVLPYVFCLLPSYPAQISAITKAAFKRSGPGSVYLVETVSPEQKEVEQQAKQAVESAGGTYLGQSSVPFGVADVTPFVLQASKGNPDYILFESAPADTTKIVAALASRNALPKKGILGLTSLPGNTYLQNVPASAQALTYTLGQTVPADASGAKDCVDAMKKYYPKAPIDTVNLAGCMIADATVAVLKKAGANPTTESVNAAAESLSNANVSTLIPPVTFSAENHTGLSSLPAWAIKNKDWKDVGNVPVPIVGGQ